MTTPQLIVLTSRPERTIDYRLSRLRAGGLVDRTRPYAASGSAPFFWWLTRNGARLIEGSSPAPGRQAPNPLFLRHTAAIAGLYVALVDIGQTVGLTITEWRRDEQSWEDWSVYGRTGRLRPDAYLQATTSVDGTPGTVGAFIEVDFATMDQARLRAKVARHRRYCADRVWKDRHPCCPALLLATTSEARVNRFLAGVERDRVEPSPYASKDPLRYTELVAACATVRAPEEAVCAPVWRSSVGDAPTTLIQLLGPEVRKYRAVVARVSAQRAAVERHEQVRLVHALVADPGPLAGALGDEECARVIRHLFDRPGLHSSHREEWASHQLDLVIGTHRWWVDDDGRSGWPPATSSGGERLEGGLSGSLGPTGRDAAVQHRRHRS
ncbi:MAG: replication-relaxation family protein [Acidimicrobiales bacterium]|nr:replication-relaxation family protein [Acidimicrobiales bacterium]